MDVCLFFFSWMFFFRTAKIKEEFNVLICSRLRIMNLYISRTPDIRWKDKMSKSRSSLPQVGCARGANTFSSHNQFLTNESLTRPVHLGFLVTLNQILGGDSSNQANNETNKNHHRRCARTCDRMATPLGKVLFST